MYIKVKKTFKNPYGMKELNKETNPFNKPCVLGIVPTTGIKNNNGYLSKFVQILGLRHNLETNCGYDVSQTPFSILLKEKGENVSDKILSLIPERDILTAKNIIRNLNIISYCDGHNETLDLIQILYDGLKEKGYQEDEVKEILSQIFVLQVVDNLKNENREYISFPYVTSIVFHNLQDDEIITWQYVEGISFPSDKFSRIVSLSLSNESGMVLYDSFGKGSLKAEQREHDFSADYVNSPVFNNLISICLINALSSSVNKQTIDLEKLMRHFDEILNKAYEYEKTHKPLEEFTKEELKQFNEYMKKFVIDYIKLTFKFEQVDDNIIKLDNERIGFIKEFLKQNKYGFMQKIDEIRKRNLKIIDYYKNYDKNETKMVIIGNSGEFPFTIEHIIRKELIEDLKNIKEIIMELQHLQLSSDSSKELQLELNEYKTNLMNNLLNPMVITIMEEYGVSFDFDLQEKIGKKI